MTGWTIRRDRLPRRGLVWSLIAVLLLLTAGAVVVQAQGSAIGPVFALRGTLTAAAGQPFDTVLTTVDGDEIGLVGRTPALEAEIVRLRNREPGLVIKVWGVRYAPSTPMGLDVIVVDSIMPGDAEEAPTPFPETPTPVATATSAATATPTVTSTAMPPPPRAVVIAAAVNVRSGPGTDYPVIGRRVAGDSCPVVGRNQDTTWLLLACDDDERGWVFGELLDVIGSTADTPLVRVPPPPTPTPTPTATATPRPTATPIATATPVFTGWRVAYFANRDLQGSAVRVVDVPVIDFDWGNGSPGAGVPADNFSARLERAQNFPLGLYAIQVTVDDGVRVYLDGRLIIDQWTIGSERTFVVQELLDGRHEFRIEYFEAGGAARLRFDTTLVSTAADWRASYYDNPTLSGTPRVVRNEPRRGAFPLDMNWQQGSPAPGRIPADRWSARWTGKFFFDGGDYRFSAIADDGVRVYIDGILVLDRWDVGYKTNIRNDFRNLGRGDHDITVEFNDVGIDAILRVWWQRIEPSGGGMRTE